MSPRVAMPMLDPAPLVEIARKRDVTNADWGARAGLTQAALERRVYQPLPWSLADRLATALHVHPCEVWGDDWWSIARLYDEMYDEATQDRLCRESIRYRDRKLDEFWSAVYAREERQGRYYADCALFVAERLQEATIRGACGVHHTEGSGI